MYNNVSPLQSQPENSPATPSEPLPSALPTASGSCPAHATPTSAENEEAVYLRTHRELQAYLPLVSHMMSHIRKKKEGVKSQQYSKLKSLEYVLQDFRSGYLSLSLRLSLSLSPYLSHIVSSSLYDDSTSLSLPTSLILSVPLSMMTIHSDSSDNTIHQRTYLFKGYLVLPRKPLN